MQRVKKRVKLKVQQVKFIFEIHEQGVAWPLKIFGAIWSWFVDIYIVIGCIYTEDELIV